MNHEVKRNIVTMQVFYLLTFFGIGSLFPLLSVYLSEVEHLNGIQIGAIMSIGPIMMIFFQPIWGAVSDKTNSPIKVLSITTMLAGIFSLGFLTLNTPSWFLLVAMLVAVFQSAIIPVSDSISLKYSSKVGINYGSIRLYGSLGYGIAVFLMGQLSEFNPKVIFYAFVLSFAASALLALRLPSENASGNKHILSGVKEIIGHKKFLIFLAITFLIFGPNLANNVYFGLFVEDRGGTYTGIGIAFLIAVLSEIPFMKAAGSWINRFGLLPVAAFAGMISLFRWLFYFTEPSLTVIYLSAVIQGLSLGLFIPVGLQYIRDITPVHISATAITLYSAIGNGFGNWFSTFFGGIIYERYSIYSVYLFFGVMALVGVILNIWLIKEERREQQLVLLKDNLL